MPVAARSTPRQQPAHLAAFPDGVREALKHHAGLEPKEAETPLSEPQPPPAPAPTEDEQSAPSSATC